MYEGRTMSEALIGNRPAFLRTLIRLLKLALFVLATALLVLYVLAIPLGLELFLFENLSTMFSPSYPVSINLFNLQAEVSLGYMFTTFTSVYVLCFVMAWRQRRRLYKANAFHSKPVSSHIWDSMFALPIVSSMTYIAVIVIHFLEESFGIFIGKPPLPSDQLLAFYELTTSPLTEEITYRILPIGVFLIVRLLALSKREKSYELWKQRLKVCLLALISPEDAKEKLGLKTVRESGLRGGVSVDEWLMILFTSVFFATSHYFYTNTWMAGKFASTFVQGLVMGLSYLVYGIQAPILLHWFFNYYLYTFSLAEIMHPSLTVLNLISQELTLSLGVLGFLMLIFPKVKSLAETKMIAPETLLRLVAKVKNEVVAKGSRLLFSLRYIDFFDLAMLILTLGVFVLRLTIINSPGPEIGGKYNETGFVFDEFYYVKAAQKMLVGEATNNEHPPLSKAFIMLGIVLFGDNPVGWRAFSIMASGVSLILIYRIVLLLGGKKSASFFAALFFTTDIMAFNTGQIAILDAPSMLFVLAGSLLLLKEKNDLGSIFLGLGSLCKLNSIFASAGIVFFLVLSNFVNRKKDLRLLKEQATIIGRIFLIWLVTFLIGLWIYDAAYRVFNDNPLEHLVFMNNYHNSLRYQNPLEVILPLQWINPFNPFSPVPYYVTYVTEFLNGSIQKYHPIAYYGLYTPLWWSIWILVPIAFAGTIRKARKNEKQRIDLFTLVWIAANYVPYIFLGYLIQRWVYPFYFYMVLPGLYACLAYYLTRSKLTKILLVLLACIQIVWFFIWFPVKPKVVTDLLLSLGLPA